MPTYEYACKACNEHLEVVQSFKDDPLTECPACGGTLRKVFGNIGIAFKGSGFYRTDSRSSSSSGTKGEGGKGEGGKGEAAKGDGKAAEAKSDTPKSSASGESSSSGSGSSSSSGSTSSTSKPAVAAAS